MLLNLAEFLLDLPKFCLNLAGIKRRSCRNFCKFHGKLIHEICRCPWILGGTGQNPERNPAFPRLFPGFSAAFPRLFPGCPPTSWRWGFGGRRRTLPSYGRREGNLGDLYAESGQTLQGSFSVVSKPNFASKYSLESSGRDLHNALLCTVLMESRLVEEIY